MNCCGYNVSQILQEIQVEGNREEIIKLAREAGMVVYDGDQDRVLFEGSVIDSLTRFFHLAQAAEREACAKVCDDLADTHEKMDQWGSYKTAEALSQAIQARGQA